MKLAEVGGSLSGKLEARGSFHRIWSPWRLQLVEAMKAFTSTNSGSFHLLPFSSMEVYVYFHVLPSTFIGASIYFHGSIQAFYFRGSFNQLPEKLP